MRTPPPGHPTTLPISFQESVTAAARTKQLLPAKEASPIERHENLATMPNCESFLNPVTNYQKRD